MRDAAPFASIVLGAHGVYITWIFDVARRLAARAPGKCVTQIDRDDGIESAGQIHRIYLTNYPSTAAIDAIERCDLGVVAVIEDPADILAFQTSALSLTYLQSIRAQTTSAVANLAIGKSQTVTILSRDHAGPAKTIVKALAQTLKVDLSQSELDIVLNEVTNGRPNDCLEAVLLRQLANYLPPARQGVGDIQIDHLNLARSVLDPLQAMLRGSTIRPVSWPTPVFKFSDHPDAPPPEIVDVAGPARTLYYGPYFHLPPCRYRVEALLAFSEEIEDVPFVLEIYGERLDTLALARARIERRKAGGYRGYFVFDHLDATQSLEIRLFVEQGVDKGKLALIELLFFVEGSVGSATTHLEG